MTLDVAHLMSLPIPDVRQQYNWRDAALYALGIGVALDPMDESELTFVDETRIVAVPTLANVLGYPGFWMRDLPCGLDWRKTVHGEHATRLHRALPAEGDVTGRTRIVDIIDKGADKGALILVERNISDSVDDTLYATVYQTVFARGDGGQGGTKRDAPVAAPLPERAPDKGMDMATSPQGALIYRLSGDYNPLHMQPAAARAAGFERPILHGLATFGAVGHALMRLWCPDHAQRVRYLSGRFSSPVFPGETLRIEAWEDAPGKVRYRARVATRGLTVVDRGSFEYETP